MRTLSIVFLSLLSGISYSQTKLISHKSHSGNNESFRVSIEENLFNIGDSNFGKITNEYTENYEKIDTIIKISNTQIVRVKSNYYQLFERSDKSKVGKLEYLNTVRDTITIENANLISNDKLKTLAKTERKNIKTIDTNKVIIVNFREKTLKEIKQEKRKAKKKKSILSIIESKPNFPSKSLLIFALILTSSFVVYFSWKTTSYKILKSNSY